MNRYALVLAADSATTVTRWEGGKREERYFKGTNKIFQLSERQPVGAMIFDTADLERVPWELILKEFRRSLSSTCCGTLEQYADRFFDFVQGHQGLFPPDYRRRIFVRRADQAMISQLREIAQLDAVQHATDAEAKKGAAGQELDRLLNLYSSSDIPPESLLDAEKVATLIQENEQALLHEAAIDLSLFHLVDVLDTSKLIHLGVHTLVRDYKKYPDTTGIVFAGYGDDDFFPRYIELECYGFLSENIIRKMADEQRISPEVGGYVKAFATTDMVNTFTLGFSPDVFRSVRSTLRKELGVFAGKVLDGIERPEVAPDLKALVEETIQEHTSHWTTEVLDRHAQPLRNVVSALPKPLSP